MSEIVFKGKVTSAKEDVQFYHPILSVIVVGSDSNDGCRVYLDFEKIDGVGWWVGREVELVVRPK